MLRTRLPLPSRVSATWVLLSLILAVALGLRLYGIGWDDGHGFHPDERSIYMQSDCMYRVLTEGSGYSNCIREHPQTEPGIPGPGAFFDADRSPLNPHWFPLGSMLIYLIVGIRSVLEPFTDMNTLLDMSYIGRSIVALADVGTVFMVFLIGRRIYGSRAGLLASALVALAVVHIQHSHFYRPEPILVFFLLSSFWGMLRMMERRRLRDSLLLGLLVGLTFAPKVSMLPILLPLALAYAYRLFASPGGGWAMPARVEATRIAGHAAFAGLVAFATFFVTMPYAILDFSNFLDQTTWQADMARTAGTVPFTVQYIDSTPFLYELRQTAVWGLGLPLGIVAWGGLLFTAWRVGRYGLSLRGELLFLAWVVPNFLMLGLFEVKFLRYIFPLIPFLVLMGSGMLIWSVDRAGELRSSAAALGIGAGRLKSALARNVHKAAVGVVAVGVVATAFYAVAFETIYSRPHTAVQASEWINDNVPRRSTIVTDNHWDEGIPDMGRYDIRQVPIYEPDNAVKMRTIAGHLADGDYLVFYSSRTYGSVARQPERYPLGAAYYQLLFSGGLGYSPEKAFTSYPELLGVAFVDDTFGRAGLPEPEGFKGDPAPLSLNLGFADENVINYDHPKVLLFKNEARLPQDQLYELLTAASDDEVPLIGLMMSEEREEQQREGGTWSEIVKRDSWTNDVPVLAWLLMVELMYLAALPLSMFLFRPLPDRGIVLARLLGILGIAYVAWMLASTEAMSFSRASVLVGILAVASLSALVLWARWREIKDFVIANWRLLAIGEALFLVAFLAFVAIRAGNPDLWHPFRGGEKPMDFAYLNAVLRSSYMPPYDPWFAGGYLNYYYWGQFIVAALIKATGIVPSVAYNLAIPLLFALTVTAAYSIVYNLAAGVRRMGLVQPVAPGPPAVPVLAPPPSTPPMENAGAWRGWRHGVAWGPVAAGVTAGLFVATMGNLDGIVQLAQGTWHTVVGDDAFPAFDFWRSSRMLPALEDISPSALTFWLPDKTFTDTGHHITEFPFFSFLFADLHAHVVAIPFTLLALGLGLSLLLAISRGDRGWWLAGCVSALAVALGALWAINSWDYPAYTLLAVFLIGAAVYLRPGSPRYKVGLFLALSAGTVVLSVLAFLPFHQNYHPFPTGLVVSKWQTPPQYYLGIHGLFFFVSATFVLYLLRHRLRSLVGHLAQRPAAIWGAAASTLNGAGYLPWAALVGGLGVSVVIVYMAAAGYWTAAMLTLMLALTAWAAVDRIRRRGEEGAYLLFPLMLLAFGLAIGIGVEFVRAKDDIGRMNTLFKFYLEAWVLFALAAAYMLWFMGSRGAFSLRGLSLARGSWLGLLAALLVASFIYPVMGTRVRMADRFDTSVATLDGADYMRRAVYTREGPAIELRWDYDAIRWLQDNVRGSPVILEGHAEQYNWSARISNYTGLPAVLGWPWHQIQQRMRYHYAVRGRAAVVRELYSTLDRERALDLLRQYEVKYVVIGDLERTYYPDHGLGKYDRFVRDGVARVAYENGGTRIYEGLWYN